MFVWGIYLKIILSDFLEKFSPEIKCFITFGLVRFESKPTYKYSADVILPQLAYAVETLETSKWTFLRSEFVQDSLQLIREFLLLDIFRLLQKNPKNQRLHFILDSLAKFSGNEEKVDLKPIATKLTNFCLENYENGDWFKKKINHVRENISINETAIHSDAITNSIIAWYQLPTCFHLEEFWMKKTSPVSLLYFTGVQSWNVRKNITDS